MMRRLAVVAVLAASAAACTPGTGGSTPTTFPPGSTAPVVSSFMAMPGSSVAPALVALRWNVSDPQGTPLTCTIDGDGDGLVDVTVVGCQGTGSRNIAIPTDGVRTAKLTVTDGTESTVATTNVTVTAGSSETFDVVLRPVAPLDPDVQAAFDAAATRFEQLVVRGIPDVTLPVPEAGCLDDAAPISTGIDDLVIDIEVTPIDGSGNVLGSAGPCLVGTDGLPRAGGMQFDSADVADLLLDGTFDEVALHEMAHVLGFGTVWTSFPGLTSAFGLGSASDPRFVGARATAEWSALGGSGGVPVEATGGPGTAEAHWRETTFDKELMTGWLDWGTTPLSRLSVASFADLGYRVDLTQADPFTLPGGAGLRTGRDALGDDVLGRVLPITPRGVV